MGNTGARKMGMAEAPVALNDSLKFIIAQVRLEAPFCLFGSMS